MPEHYEVYYRDILIGRLSVDENGRHAYKPEKAGIAAVEDRVCLLRVMKEGTDGYGEPIPFFQNRLYNMKRNGLHQMNYQTDWFWIREVME